jgi:hypothetical protein
MKLNKADPSINAHLTDMMQGSSEDEVAEDEKEQCLPIKSKQKTFFVKVTASKPTNPKAKSVKTRIDTHSHQ